MRSLSLSLLALLLFASAIAVPTPALANGILVTDGGQDVWIEPPPPPPPDRIRWVPPRPTRVPPVRLKAHRVTATITDQVADVTVEQIFHNDSGMQLEGTYLFPLPDGAAVSKFAMTMGGRMVEGEIIEANEARRIYQSIVSRRRDPGLLEYMGRGLFKARVFPIMPHSDLTIRLAFQQVLSDDRGTVEFRYPLATDRLNGQPVEDVVVDVKVESSVDLKAIYSPSHEVAVSRDGDRRARVSYERTARTQDKDFLLYVGRSPDAVGFSLLSTRRSGEDGTFMAILSPRTTVPAKDLAPKDVVYVLDTSGSMVGEKMRQAQRALAVGVGMLRPADRFNIIAFSGTLNPFRENLVPATDELKRDATTWIDALQAVGGTNIEGALTQALSTQSGGRLLLVVFITDGRPTIGERDAEAIVSKVKSTNASKARVFTFGVGYELDVTLLDRIAEVTNGSRDYVAPSEDIEVVTGRFFSKVDQPVLSDIRLELGSGIRDVYPQRVPDLFAGGQLVVFGRYLEAGDRVVRLHGTLAGRPVTYEYEGTLRANEGPAFLPRLWAQRKVAFLLDEIRLHGENKELVDEVIRLATRHAIVTPYTAGLVVEEGELEGRLLRGGDAGSGRGARERTLGGLLPPSGGASRPNAAGLPTPAAPVAEPAKPAEDSARISHLKELAREAGDEKEKKDGDLDDLRARTRSVAGKSFILRDDGRWVDTLWDGKKATTKVEAFSEAYFALLAKGDDVAKVLGIGERVVFVLGDVVYEVTAAATTR
jgi:Ca-activated chloride channel family protein